MNKLSKSFYQQPALDIVKQFLGKYLVYNSPRGRLSGKIIDVEAYPAFIDEVSHGNKRTKRTEVMYGKGGYAYVYMIYGVHHQFAVVVNKEDIPEVIFIRALVPDQGIEIMRENFEREVKNIKDFTKSPGNLCKSFGINMDLYGADVTGNKIFIEDRGIMVDAKEIISAQRVGVASSIKGSENRFRYFIKKYETDSRTS